MARSFRICNTSDDNEPLRIHMAFSDEPRDLKPGEVSGEYRLNAPKDEALSMRIESLDAPERGAPAFNDDGERVFPKVEVYWRAAGETHPVDALKDRIASLESDARQAHLDKVDDSSEFNELHRQIRELNASLRLVRCDKANLAKTASVLESKVAELKAGKGGWVPAEVAAEKDKEIAELRARRDEDEETSLAEMNAKQCDTIRDLDAEVAELKRRCDEQKETILELLADRRKLDAVRNALR